MTLTLEQSAALAGAHCWAERRLFEVLGAWSAQASSAPATLLLDRHAQHAAWRAGQWWDRLPVLARLDRDALIVPASGWTALDAPIFAAGGVPPGVEPLAIAYRVVVPRLVVAYARHAGAATPVADGPTLRTLGHVRPDLAADWAEGEAGLQDLLVDPEEVEAATAAAAAAERLFLASAHQTD